MTNDDIGDEELFGKNWIETLNDEEFTQLYFASRLNLVERRNPQNFVEVFETILGRQQTDSDDTYDDIIHDIFRDRNVIDRINFSLLHLPENWSNMRNTLRNSNLCSNLPDQPNFIESLSFILPTRSSQLSALLPGDNLSSLLSASASLIETGPLNALDLLSNSLFPHLGSDFHRICRGKFVDLPSFASERFSPTIECKVPQLLLDLRNKCLDIDPQKRPTAKDLVLTLRQYRTDILKNRKTELCKQIEEIENSTENSLNCSQINSAGFNYKRHPQATYTSSQLMWAADWL
ncbi:3314_t:CDS:2 [Cetraspora pellucida]|uniref:3314_t:CDS:1 n=1 Tax=Cetraspora pellucida TaxID=1433469 RepID=A0A9N9F5C1_9GLOM|nr:3314_t:CDS:2 [Cetraspora pellucida]